MTEGTIRGTMTQADEDPEFLRFFRVVQDAASAIGKVFFLWSTESRDGQVGDVWCEDLGGWLVPVSDADEFERLWSARNPSIWEPRFDPLWSFARWSESPTGDLLINFE